jgi:hypothetical protein
MEEAITKRCSGGKLVKVAVKANGGAIEDIRITGDFFTHPEGVIEALERKLVGMKRDQIGRGVKEELGEGTLVIGFNPEELIIMIEKCLR